MSPSYRPLAAVRAPAAHRWSLPEGTVVYWDSPRSRKFYEEVAAEAHVVRAEPDPSRYLELSADDRGMEFERVVEPGLSLGALLVLTPELAEPDDRRFVYLPEEGRPVTLTVNRCSDEPLSKIFAAVGQAVARERRRR